MHMWRFLQHILVPSLLWIWLVTVYVCVQCAQCTCVVRKLAKSYFIFLSLSVFFIWCVSAAEHCIVQSSKAEVSLACAWHMTPVGENWFSLYRCTDASVSLRDVKLFQFVPIPNALYSRQHSIYVPVRFFSDIKLVAYVWIDVFIWRICVQPRCSDFFSVVFLSRPVEMCAFLCIAFAVM